MADRVLGGPAMRLAHLRGGAAVVLYHRISDSPDPAYPPLTASEFAAHLDLLTSAYRVVPLADLVSRSTAGRPVTGYCAVTFDDGFRDFLDTAYPLLRRFGVPCTHFLVVDCLLTGRPTWNLRLARMVQHDRDRGLTVSLPGLKAELATKSVAERFEWLAVEESERPALPPEPAMLSPQDLGAFGDEVTWGSHTLSHADLRAVDAEGLTAEVAGSRERLRELTGSRVDGLAYPNGWHDERSRRAAAAAGYGFAMAVGQRPLADRPDPFAVPRLDLGAIPADRLRLEMSGVVPALRRVRGG